MSSRLKTRQTAGNSLEPQVQYLSVMKRRPAKNLRIGQSASKPLYERKVQRLDGGLSLWYNSVEGIFDASLSTGESACGVGDLIAALCVEQRVRCTMDTVYVRRVMEECGHPKMLKLSLLLSTLTISGKRHNPLLPGQTRVSSASTITTDRSYLRSSVVNARSVDRLKTYKYTTKTTKGSMCLSLSAIIGLKTCDYSVSRVTGVSTAALKVGQKTTISAVDAEVLSASTTQRAIVIDAIIRPTGNPIIKVGGLKGGLGVIDSASNAAELRSNTRPEDCAKPVMTVKKGHIATRERRYSPAQLETTENHCRRNLLRRPA